MHQLLSLKKVCTFLTVYFILNAEYLAKCSNFKFELNNITIFI